MSVIYNDAFNKLMENEAFVKEMLSQKSAEDVQKLYSDNGVELTMDDVLEIAKTLNTFDGSEELDADQLDDVAGGVVITAATCWAVARTVLTVGAIGHAAYKWYKRR